MLQFDCSFQNDFGFRVKCKIFAPPFVMFQWIQEPKCKLFQTTSEMNKIMGIRLFLARSFMKLFDNLKSASTLTVMPWPSEKQVIASSHLRSLVLICDREAKRDASWTQVHASAWPNGCISQSKSQTSVDLRFVWPAFYTRHNPLRCRPLNGARSAKASRNESF